jgi:hypothetical protein
MRPWILATFRLAVVCVGVLGSLCLAHAAEWPPISKEELAMTDDPANPGAAAILLYREVVTDDIKGFETEYRRIKVLNDDGKKYADIEIPYVDKVMQIEGIQARTLRADGTPVDFKGQILDRTAIKARRTKVQVKAFTLPEVQKGSIIEYSYTSRSREKSSDVLKNPGDYRFVNTIVVPSTTWLVQEELFTRRARFTLHSFPKAKLLWQLGHIPESIHLKKEADGTITMELENFQAFQTEELMPPDRWEKSRITFYYVLGPSPSGSYWQEYGASYSSLLVHVLGDSKKLKPLVSSIVSTEDSPETQLRKIYNRVQQIPRVGVDLAKTDQELKRENLKENKNVEDVLKHNYAYSGDINHVFVALVRAAGFESALVLVKNRETGFFIGELPDSRQLDASVVWVRAGEKDYFLDPATRYCPFGLLPWYETATLGTPVTDGPKPTQSALKNFSDIVATPNPTSAEAITERKAVLQLDAQGSVEGSVEIAFNGQDALVRRYAARNMDEAARKKSMEDELKNFMPQGADLKLQGSINWEQTDQPLRVNFTVKAADYAALTGRRILFRQEFFKSSATAFKESKRVHDVYFAYPWRETDDVTWKLPSDFQTASLPERRNDSTVFGNYSMAVESGPGTIHASRNFTSEVVYLQTGYYGALRSYFNIVRMGDESQVVLERTEAQRAQ